jgi:hypothetical protein
MSGEYTRALQDLNVKMDTVIALLKRDLGLPDITIRKGVSLVKARLSVVGGQHIPDSVFYEVVRDCMRLALQEIKG